MTGPYLRSTALLTLRTQFTAEEVMREMHWQVEQCGIEIFDDRTLKAMIENLLADRRKDADKARNKSNA